MALSKNTVVFARACFLKLKMCGILFIYLDIILVGLRDYQDQKADVIMKYNSDEARRLKNLGHLPESVNVRSI